MSARIVRGLERVYSRHPLFARTASRGEGRSGYGWPLVREVALPLLTWRASLQSEPRGRQKLAAPPAETQGN